MNGQGEHHPHAVSGARRKLHEISLYLLLTTILLEIKMSYVKSEFRAVFFRLGSLSTSRYTLPGAVKPGLGSAGKLGDTILWSVIIGGGALAACYLLH
jgi:hypothetical protein